MASGLLIKDVWPLERATVTQRNLVVLRRWGMTVTVTDDPTPANNTTWVLVKGLSSNDKKDNNNWQTITDYVGGGGGGSSTPKTAVFAGDGATTVFTVVETDAIIIANVFQGGQLLIEGTQYIKDDAAKTVSFVSAPPSNQHIDITYFVGINIGEENPPLDAVSVITTGSDITLNFASLTQRIFNGLTSFTGAKNIQLSNDDNALVFCFNFQVTGSGAALTFPNNFKSSDSRFAGNILTLVGSGFYEVTCVYDSVNLIWKLKAEVDGGVL